MKSEYSGKSETYYWFKTLPKGKVIMVSLGISPNPGRMLMDFDPPLTVLPEKPVTGAAWEHQLPGHGDTLFTAGKYRIESEGETVTVPAGTFRNCLKVKQVILDENGKEVGVLLHWYARGVGEVLSEQLEPEGRRYRSELQEYSVK